MSVLITKFLGKFPDRDDEGNLDSPDGLRRVHIALAYGNVHIGLSLNKEHMEVNLTPEEALTVLYGLINAIGSAKHSEGFDEGAKVRLRWGHKEPHKPTKEFPLHEGVRKLYLFANGYGASVVRHKYSYGWEEGLWELGVTTDDGELCYDTPITSDVIGYLTDIALEKLLDEIEALPVREQ